MEQFEEYPVHQAGPAAIMETDAADWLEADVHERENFVEEPVSTDDPVRVYLREMGSVRLLSRQGEIDLAIRMERGKLRARKALSRSEIVWRRVAEIDRQVGEGEIRLTDVVELGAHDDEAAAKRARIEVGRLFSRF